MASSTTTTQTLHCTQLYFFVSDWMASNRLKLNLSKPEIPWCTPANVAGYLTRLQYLGTWLY